MKLKLYLNKGTRVGFINEDEVFGELSILLNTKRTVTAIALKESKALLIPKKNLLNDYNKTSFFIKAILRSTYMRLTNLNSTIKIDLKNLNEKRITIQTAIRDYIIKKIIVFIIILCIIIFNYYRNIVFGN